MNIIASCAAVHIVRDLMKNIIVLLKSLAFFTTVNMSSAATDWGSPGAGWVDTFMGWVYFYNDANIYSQDQDAMFQWSEDSNGWVWFHQTPENKVEEADWTANVYCAKIYGFDGGYFTTKHDYFPTVYITQIYANTTWDFDHNENPDCSLSNSVEYASLLTPDNGPDETDLNLGERFPEYFPWISPNGDWEEPNWNL